MWVSFTSTRYSSLNQVIILDHLWCWILLHDVLDFLLVCRAVLLEQVERICLRWRFRVRLVKQRLDTEEDLLDSNSRSPAFFLVKDGQAHGAGRVYVGVE
jgi:hypothetical protein